MKQETNSSTQDPSANLSPSPRASRLLEALVDAADDATTINQYLGHCLATLVKTTHAMAGILWLQDGEKLRWLESVGVQLSDAHGGCEYTNDVVANAHDALVSHRADIFACSGTTLTEDVNPDHLMRRLVLHHRQLVMPTRIEDQQSAVIVLFQSVHLPPSAMWSSDELAAAGRAVELGIQQVIADDHEMPLDDDAPDITPQSPTSGSSWNWLPTPVSRPQTSDSAGSVPQPPGSTGAVPQAAKAAEDRVAQPNNIAQTGTGADEVQSHPHQSPESRLDLARAYERHNVESATAVARDSEVEQDQTAAIPGVIQTSPASDSVHPLSFDDLLRFNSVVSASLDETECAFDVANELHNVFPNCRVSVAIGRGAQFRIKAISNQTHFDRRSPIVVSLERLATHCASIAKPVFHPEHATHLTDKSRHMFEDYYTAADTRAVGLIPIFERPRVPKQDARDVSIFIRTDHSRPGHVIAMVILESVRERGAAKDILPTWTLLEAPVTNAVVNARKHSGLFLMPVWRSLGKLTGRPSRVAAVAIAAALVVACLTLIPSDLKLRCEGVIQPIERSHVFAATPGVVDEITCQNGEWVEKGAVLMRLADPELSSRLAAVEGELRETRQKLRTSNLQRLREEFVSLEQRQRIVIECAGYEAKLSKLQEQYDLLLEKQEQLTIVSPTAGQVVSWDTNRKLLARPVKAGDELLMIANPNSGWELELRLPDKRVGYLKAEDLDSQAASAKTTFVLASNPAKVCFGRLRELSKAAEVDQEVGNSVRVYVDVDEMPVSNQTLRPGTEVVAYLHAGRTSLGYSKLYEFFDWISRTWFKFA